MMKIVKIRNLHCSTNFKRSLAFKRSTMRRTLWNFTHWTFKLTAFQESPSLCDFIIKPPRSMQMALRYYLVAWNEGLPKAASHSNPSLPRRGGVISFLQRRREPLASLWSNWQEAERRSGTGCGQPADLWVKTSGCAALPQPNDGGREWLKQ